MKACGRLWRASTCRIGGQPVVLLVTMFVLSCNFPLHFAQSPQILVYYQRYRFCRGQEKLRNLIIEHLMGIEAKESPKPKDEETLLVRGTIYLRIAPVPGDTSLVTLEGHGWHRLYYGQTEDDDAFRYLAAADFEVADTGPIALSDLSEQPLTIKVHVINHSRFHNGFKPRDAFYGTDYIYLLIYLRKIADGLYDLDYQREHPVGWRVAANGPREYVQTIGTTQFAGSSDGRTLFDVRKIPPLAMDYPSLMKGQLDVPMRSVGERVVTWRPAYACPERIVETRP
jgi:hypothetical protein